ncbi:VOC family protein [Gloeobacter kilaueensis]|uniref:Glyoxalase/bleomycin resistance protein/dioxygenase n=1 Tax=Gloeobacter kilaueensis (strain ATCC BAA-2537 / CCAP 1431/1 / ULC 316 / JS1) TaxID=1183438 RepID=U5QDW0_GLOK1|nr:VOC family protein [Gloeobacter kilaueensis]AGY57058.1 glyoxalase/bleomycin resistance protein/dioxygenase [Gloeobacter kilaueensis JS1]
MFDHISISIQDLDKSIAFYDAVFAPLGYQFAFRHPRGAAYGPNGRPLFWLDHRPTGQPAGGGHFAFAAPSRTAVDSFYQAALGQGGKDNGPPGLRSHYHPNYYAAFVLDPDGHRLEAVYHSPA